jgi:hypothetical protein
MAAATIKVFLPSGDAKRLRTAEISNWAGKAVAAPRSEFKELLGRDELASAGVYLLTGVNPKTGETMVYIGEAEVVRDRIKNHTGKDFWNQALVFVSKDANLTKSHIKYLEGRLIERTREIGKTSLDNQQASGAKLPESDQADMEVFLSRILQLLPLLGTDILTPIEKFTGKKKEETALYCEIKGLKAFGARTPNGFVVYKGSQAVIAERPSAYKFILELRQKLQQDGSLVNKGDHYLFSKDVEFSSPSAAAVVIVGGNANGLREWKNKAGTMLKDVEEGKLQS